MIPEISQQALAQPGVAQPATETMESMLATLCCYEHQFGPYSPVTLRMMAEVGAALGRRGETGTARLLLERAARDLARFLGPDHPAAVEARVHLAWLSAPNSFE